MKKSRLLCALTALGVVASAWADFNGLGMSLGNLATLSSAKSRCISPENRTGESGRAAMAVPSETITQNVNNASYFIDYTLTEIGDDQAYFHAQFRRTHWNETSDFVLADGIRGRGHFVGTYLAWGVHNDRWWGEGETKFFIDDDDRFPTLCSTGLEDYFCGSYNFDRNGRYQEYCTPYAGLCQVIRPDGRAGADG